MKKRRSVQYALLEVNFQIEAADVAPHGYRLSASVGCIEVVALKRKYTFPAVYVQEACVHLILDFIRHELEG